MPFPIGRRSGGRGGWRPFGSQSFVESKSSDAMRPEGSAEPRLSAVTLPRTVDVLGAQLAVTDYDATLDWIDASVASGTRGYLCACNVHTVMASREDSEL